MSSIGLLICNKYGEKAVLSGKNDNESYWNEIDVNKYASLELPKLNVKINDIPDNNGFTYRYSIELTNKNVDDYYIQVIDIDCCKDLSSNIKLKDIIDVIASDDYCERSKIGDKQGWAILNAFGKRIMFTKEIIVRMTGTIETFQIYM